MTEERYWELMDDSYEKLAPEEIAKGWHFCEDWDFLLVGPDMEEAEACTCRERIME